MENAIQELASGAQAGPLTELYKTVPNWRAILTAVAAGRAEFSGALASMGLSALGSSTSVVHPDHDIELHAFILGIVSGDRSEEIQTKAFLTYASHWIDDFFDNPEKVPDAEQLLADRKDIRLALSNMGPIGEVGFAMANRVPHPEAIYKTLHRMLYGGLVQRSLCRSTRQALVREYQEVATRFVDPVLVARIRHLQPEAYWTTNKSVLEISNAAEPCLDFTTAELWNLVYASALYYQDADEERARGELNFDETDAPRVPEMLNMIRLGGEYLTRCGRDTPQMRQLQFVAMAIPNLPAEVVREYRSIWSGAEDSPTSVSVPEQA